MKSIFVSIRLVALRGLLFAFISTPLLAQINLDFNSQDFGELGFSGDTSNFIVKDQKLYLNANAGSSSSKISLINAAIYNAAWEFTIGMEFNPSSSNYMEIQLAGDETGENGYFIRLGGSEDDIRLYLVIDGNKNILIDGADDRLDMSSVDLSIIVDHDSTGLWTISSKIDFENEYSVDGSGLDNTLTSSSHFAINCHYTSTRVDKFWLDNIKVTGTLYPDFLAPQLDSVAIINDQELNLFFNESIYLDSITFSQTIISSPQQNELDSFWIEEGNELRLRFNIDFINGHNHTIVLSGIADEVGNILDSTFSFLYYIPSQVSFGDIIINEVMVDPNPTEDLPAAEFIEIWNVSNNPQNLQDWKLLDNRSETFFTNYILLPGHFLILTSLDNDELYTQFGPALGLASWPTLNNDEDELQLLDGEGTIIYEFEYKISAFVDEKMSGGWSLELINPENPCNLMTNWGYSENMSGGTPGNINSIYNNSPDSIAPFVSNINLLSDSVIAIHFSESIMSSVDTLIRIDEEIIQDYKFIQELNNELHINLKNDLQSNNTYHLELSGFTDCFSNPLLTSQFELSFDLDPPRVDSVFSIHANQIEITFDEPINSQQLSAEIEFLPGHDLTIMNQVTPKQISILLDTFFVEPFPLEILLANLEDTSGNFISNLPVPFNYQPPVIAKYSEIGITEFIVDPIPSAGLPEVEFIELTNYSNTAFSMRGMTISDGSTTGIILDGIIEANEIVILTNASKVSEFEKFGKTISVSPWPNLNSSGDSIVLRNVIGEIIYSVVYKQDWFTDVEKIDGGWSLELISFEESCLGKYAWTVSENNQGGTPGSNNSINEIILPELIMTQFRAIASDSILLEFTRPVLQDSLGLLEIIINDSINSESQIIIGPDNASTILVLPTISVEDSLSIKIIGFMDCVGNEAIVEFSYPHDNTNPDILAYSTNFKNRMDILFSEDINISTIHPSVKNFENIHFETIFPVSDRIDTIAIIFSELEDHHSFTLKLDSLSDLAGNSTDILLDFEYVAPKIAGFHELIITEIMATPSPNIELNSEYIEIYNPSSERIPLNGYSVSDNRTSIFLEYTAIEANSYVIIVPQNSSMNLPEDIQIIRTSPSIQLNKSRDKVILTNSEGQNIHEINYDDSWYNSEWKMDGGWSLEMIDFQNPCGEAGNWTASENEKGGTPGKINSVDAVKTDLKGPEILEVWANTSDTINVLFNEKMEPSSLISSGFSMNKGIEIQQVLLEEDRKEARLILNNFLESGQSYELMVEGVLDCNGNIFTDSKTIYPVVLPAEPEENDFVINEILFNPDTGGSDFIELFNRSNKYLQLKSSFLIGEKDTVSINENLIVGPGEFLVLTEDKSQLLNHFPASVPETIREYPLPSWPDDQGKAAFLSSDSKIIDEMEYTEEMHMDLFFDVEGISLERVAIDQSSSNTSNWKSASSILNGTPGYKNSQSHRIRYSSNPISISPVAFNPRDHFENFLTISYNFDGPGYIGNLEIYNLDGRIISQLMSSEYLPQHGFITWQGTDDGGNVVPTGSYIVYFEIFNTEGQVSRFKELAVVATRF